MIIRYNTILSDKDQKYRVSILSWNIEYCKYRVSSSKIDFLTGEEILLLDQRSIIEQANFINSHLDKAFAKWIKAIQDQGIKPIGAVNDVKSKENKEGVKQVEIMILNDMRTDEVKAETDENKES